MNNKLLLPHPMYTYVTAYTILETALSDVVSHSLFVLVILICTLWCVIELFHVNNICFKYYGDCGNTKRYAGVAECT